MKCQEELLDVGDGGVRSLQSTMIFLRFVLENLQAYILQPVITMAFPFVGLFLQLHILQTVRP